MSNYRTKDVGRLAETFRALSNPNRLRILLRLASSSNAARDSGANAGTLAGNLDIAASTLSHHLKELRVAGLIRMQRRGKNVACEIDRETLRELSDLFAKRLFTGTLDPP
jgi:ArsR family transcriptional regulator